MIAVEVLFWTCCVLALHTYAIYPAFLFAASSAVQLWRDWQYLRARQDRRRPSADSLDLPAMSLVIPVHNEERHLADKFASLRALDYPKDRISIVFVSDGSTDGTNPLLRAVEGGNIEVQYLPVRSGKATAINHAVARARSAILVFSDAATLFAPDALRKLGRHFADPRVGVVCGALRFEGSVESRQTEGVYWRYESMLRLMESRLGVTLTASGAIYAMRRECFVPFPADTLVEDLLVPMNARRAGYRVLYDPEAIATDFAASSVAGEFTRRVRIATGCFRALGGILRGPLDPLTAFAFFSHKLLRWVLPFLLLGMLLTSVSLLDRSLYRALFGAQLVFYAWAALGYAFRQRVQGIRFALVAYYLLAIHLAYAVGLIRYLSSRRENEWRQVS